MVLGELLSNRVLSAFSCFRYVGSHCVVELLQEGFNVAILDNLSNSCKGEDEFI